MKFNRFVIASPKSGSGKTLITIALMQAFLNDGKRVCGFKCGPDYIDPMFHKKILGVPSKNLDLFFSDEEQVRALFCDGNEADVSIIEGVMGLYDGLGADTQNASSYHLARTLKAPIILVVDAKGMAYSVVALINGFLSLDAKGLIKGVILNNTSKNVFEKLSPLIKKECGIEALGYFPNQKGLEIESRHLGLKLPDEISDIKEKVFLAAEKIKRTVDLEQIYELSQSAPDLGMLKFERGSPAILKKMLYEKKVRIAVARDEAFCFYYDDNLKLLESYGAELVEFSPLHDCFLPENICGIILGGGYPEFYAGGLEKNASIRNEIREKIGQGLPSLAECGGFMYLHNSIQTQNKSVFKMVGAIDAEVRYTGKLVRFGYASVKEKNSFFSDNEIKAHEFHYFDSTCNGSDCVAVKNSGIQYECAQVSEQHFWSFLHLYYPSNPEFAESFVKKCRSYGKSY